MLIVPKTSGKENGFSSENAFHPISTSRSHKFVRHRRNFSLFDKEKGEVSLSLHAAYCKPCSVPLRATAIYLHIAVSCLCLHSHRQAPLPNLGFSLAGFTRSIPTVSDQARLCGTFTASNHSNTLGINAAVRRSACLDLSFHPAQTLQSSQIVRAWTFL